MNVSHRAWACLTFLVSVQCAALHFIVLIVLLSLISRSSFWHFGCFSFRLWYRPWCVHIHATDPSVAMHRLCLFFFLWFTAWVEVREEANQTALNGCQYHWASNAPTVGASLIHGMPSTFIADTSRRLKHRVQIPGTTSPCQWPNEVIKPLGFFANMIPSVCCPSRMFVLLRKCLLQPLRIVRLLQ